MSLELSTADRHYILVLKTKQIELYEAYCFNQCLVESIVLASSTYDKQIHTL